jgi:hypothetical protein
VSEAFENDNRVDIAVAHFDETDRLTEYRAFHGVPDRIRLLADPDRRLYRAFSVGRGRWWRVWGPRTFVAYARLMGRGGRYHRHQGDALQLGGDLVIGREGTLEWAFLPAEPDARPSVAAVVAAVEAARS